MNERRLALIFFPVFFLFFFFFFFPLFSPFFLFFSLFIFLFFFIYFSSPLSPFSRYSRGFLLRDRRRGFQVMNESENGNGGPKISRTVLVLGPLSMGGRSRSVEAGNTLVLFVRY